MKAAFENVRDEMRREADKGADAAARGQTVIPELSFADMRADKISDATRGQIRARGCVVIRGVFERSRAEDWNGEIGDCLERNNSVERPQEKAGLDNYFGDLKKRQATDKRHLLVAPAGRGAAGPLDGRNQALPEPAVGRVRATGDEFDPDFDYA